jgi:hypothetical protein
MMIAILLSSHAEIVLNAKAIKGQGGGGGGLLDGLMGMFG